MKQIVILITVITLSFLTPRLYSQWVRTNGPHGANVNCIAANSSKIFAGTNTGLFISTDNGVSWEEPSNKVLISTLFVNNDDIYITSNNNLFRSDNDGKTWVQIDSFLKGGGVFVHLDSFLYTLANDPGLGYSIFRSSDKGNIWESFNGDLDGQYPNSLFVAGKNLFVYCGNNNYRSSNYGENWTLLKKGLGGKGILYMEGDNEHLFAVSSQEIFISSDTGNTWTNINGGVNFAQIQSLLVANKKVFVGTGLGEVYLSTNTGSSWSLVISKLPPQSSIRALYQQNSTLFAGTAPDGIFSTTDDGNTWEDRNKDFKCRAVNTLYTYGEKIFAGCNGTLFNSIDEGSHWLPVDNNLPRTTVRAFTSLGSNLFSGSEDGVKLSLDSGVSWIPSNNGLPRHSNPPLHNDVGMNVMAFAVMDNNLFVGGGQGMFKSSDSGKTWLNASNGLKDTVIYSLAVLGNTIFAGTSKGLFLSVDNGANWVSSDPADSPEIVTSIVVNGSKIYASVNRYLYYSFDTGLSWLPLNDHRAVGRLLLVNDSNIFGFGNSFYLNVSSDLGKSWMKVDMIQTNSFALSLAIKNDLLYAGTNDGSIWKSPLSEIISPSAVSKVSKKENSVIAYPNPLSHSTTINFTLTESGFVQISVINLLGQEVAQLYSGILNSGEHSFTWDAHAMPQGVYSCIVKMNDKVERVSLVVQK